VQTKNLESKTKQNNGINSNNNETIEVENNDISYCLNKNVCDELKLKFLTSPWMPDKNYVFSTSTTSKKKLKFQFGGKGNNQKFRLQYSTFLIIGNMQLKYLLNILKKIFIKPTFYEVIIL